ncbi:non-heme iron oxygenase ferredoxin subunit [Henriciella aquimarina]|uniref:non-heme iron oxygenase ferredoxin subunit n=1 Tax=Henriciella aquimarina TaxID=545261 RepID=UPI000A055FDE|nr:non-heme iron oxygenase ferredoxin subunit [Henriciella aquimarina]
MTWIPTVNVDDVEDEDVVPAQAGPHRLAIYRYQDEFFATANICSHGQANLSDGYLEEYTIECPLHQGTFDIRTGEPTGAPCTEAIRSFPVKVDNGVVHVQVESEEA